MTRAMTWQVALRDLALSQKGSPPPPMARRAAPAALALALATLALHVAIVAGQEGACYEGGAGQGHWPGRDARALNVHRAPRASIRASATLYPSRACIRGDMVL